MNPFAKPSLISNDKDVKALLARCTNCIKTINNGNNIINIEELPLRINTRKTISFIINILPKSEVTPTNNVGHYVVAIFSNLRKICIFSDPLNKQNKNSLVQKLLKNICKTIKYRFVNFNSQYQQSTSLICAQLTTIFHHMLLCQYTLNFEKLLKIFKKHSIKSLEKKMIKTTLNLNKNFK